MAGDCLTAQQQLAITCILQLAYYTDSSSIEILKISLYLCFKTPGINNMAGNSDTVQKKRSVMD